MKISEKLLNTSPVAYSAYRPEVDGLRAIAVLSVMLYHLNNKILTGGFVGVDVFFVISGYLITSQIQSDIAKNSFSIKNFYLRRIRRILPPLLTMLVVSSLAALVILKPADIVSFVKSLMVQPLALQNIFFLGEGNYFRGADTKPLLHTWSLAVEEQFYLFWPLIFLMTRKRNISIRLVIIIFVIFFSFYANLSLSQSAPQAAFYLIFSRAWELAIGGIAVFLEERKWLIDKVSNINSQIFLCLSGMALILSFVYIDSTMVFPGKIAALPVISTFLIIILTKNTKTAIGNVLSNSVLVKIGLISYPLYLWHWPILVFMRHLRIGTVELLPVLLFWFLTFGLALLSYWCIEIPIRRKEIFSTPRRLLAFVAICFMGLIGFGINTIFTDGASYRYDERAKAFLTAKFNSRTGRCYAWDLVKNLNPPICKLTGEVNDKKRILVWGNSHAGMWRAMLEQLARENKSTLYINKQNCRPVFGGAGNCDQKVKTKIMEHVQALGINTVIFASTWSGFNDSNESQQLSDLISWFTLQHISVWLVIDPASNESFDPLAAYAKNPKSPLVGRTLYEEYNRLHRANELALFVQLKERFRGVHIIDPSNVFCDAIYCYGGKANDIWYHDASHLTDSGAFAARAVFLPVFKDTEGVAMNR